MKAAIPEHYNIGTATLPRPKTTIDASDVCLPGVDVSFSQPNTGDLTLDDISIKISGELLDYLNYKDYYPDPEHSD